jgi:hypothetical protein
MAYIRTYGSSLTTGTPFVALIANEDDPNDYTVVGGDDMKAMVDHRWKMYQDRGMPADHKTLITTIGGSYTTVPDWSPAGDDLQEAIVESEAILRKGEPLPGALIVP